MRIRPLAAALLAGALLLPVLPAAAQSPSASPASTSASPAATAAASYAIGDPDLVRAIDATVGAGTVRTMFSVVFDGGGMVPDGTSISGSGQTSFGPERHQRLSLDMTAFDIGEFELIVDGDRLYARGLPFGDSVPADKWLAADLTDDDPVSTSLRALASGNNDASLLLYYLLGAAGPAELVAEEDVDGVPTRHVRTSLDLDRALALAPAEVKDTLAANLADVRAGGVEPVLEADAWIDEQDLVQRIVLAYTLGTGMGGGTMTVTFDFREHGAPLDLGIPAPEDTVEASTLAG
jgi:hypothetical protein